MKVERHVLKKITLHKIIREMYEFLLINNVYVALKVHRQSNPIITAISEAKTPKNITLKNKILSNTSRSRAPATSKTEGLATLVIS